MSTNDKSWYTRPPGIPDRTASGGVIVRLENQKVLVALVKERKDSEFILPKGKVEKGETLEDAAKREIAEEAGISKLELLCLLGTESRLNQKKEKWVTTHYFLFRTRQSECHPTDENHDYETKWFDIESLPKMYWREQHDLIVNNKDKIVRLAKN
jgi:ADP-ribose pyrophosphatase YjhB (NUDIX family)